MTIKLTPEEQATLNRRRAMRAAKNKFGAKVSSARLDSETLQPLPPKQKKPKKLKPKAKPSASLCKQCGGEIRWTRENDRWQCYNAGTDEIHWDTCSRRRWQQTKATGVRFENESQTGYTRSVHGTKLESTTGKWITGSDYREDTSCRNCVPPWEVCPGCPNNLPGQLLGGSEGDSAQKTRQGQLPFSE